MLLPPSFSESSYAPTFEGAISGLRVTNVYPAGSADIGHSGVWRKLIRVTAGSAVVKTASGFFITVSLTRNLVKNVELPWSRGSSENGSVGCKDNSPLDNGDWYVYLIFNSSRRIVDVITSRNPTAPSLPQGFHWFCKIGTFYRTVNIVEVPPPNSESWYNTKEWSGSTNEQISNTNDYDYLSRILLPQRVFTDLIVSESTYPVANTAAAFCGCVTLFIRSSANSPPRQAFFPIPHLSTQSVVLPKGGGVYHIINSNVTYPGSGAFAGGCLLRDGRVFLVPYNATQARIYDPVTDTVSIPAGSYPGGAAYAGGVLLPNGTVFMIPYNATQARIYNPVTNTVSTVSHTFPGSGAYFGGVLTRRGKAVLMVPYNATALRAYYPEDQTVAVLSNSTLFPGGGAFLGSAVYYPTNGNLHSVYLLVPYNSTKLVGIGINVFSGSFGASDMEITFPGNGAYAGAVTLCDGKTYFAPFNATTVRCFDQRTNTLSTLSGSYSGSGKWLGAAGYDTVLFAPFNHSDAYTRTDQLIDWVPLRTASSPFLMGGGF